MTSQQFSKFINNPGLVYDQHLQLLEEFVTRYPYCQSGQLLLASNLFLEENVQYPDQLKKAAAYAGDRRILKELIGRAKKTGSVPEEPLLEFREPAPASPPPVSHTLHAEPEIRLPENGSPAYERMTQEELLAIVKKRLAEINAEKNREQFAPHIPYSATRLPETEFPLTKASLIEKFILEEPRISKPKTAFFNPTDSSVRSNFDEEEIVSETLAQLYAQQGNIQKAVHIYEKLTLLNQEKSRYFAAQIEKLGS